MGSILHSLGDIFKLTLKGLGLINTELKYEAEFNPINPKSGNSETNKYENIFQLVKKGDKEDFLKTIQSLDNSFLYEVFPQSSDTLIHWTSLSGNLEMLSIVKDIYENIKDENKPMWSILINRKNALEQTPLHWACTIENLSVIKFLLKEGAHIDAIDSKGVTPLIMASQYGNVSGATYLISNGANIFLTDFEGDNALHWALYKGHAELGRLLAFYGLNCAQKDSYGQTPLHFACLSGNISCVADLVEKENVELNIYDNNNKTPLILAAGRNYRPIVEYLKFHIKSRIKSLSTLIKLKYRIFGSPNRSRFALIFFLVWTLGWGNPYYFYVMRPHSIENAEFVNHVFLMSQLIMWVSFVMTTFKNPGYMKQNSTEYTDQLNQIRSFDDFQNIKIRDYKHPINKICHSCRGIKPLRTRHCKICDRCVDEMDHHCPYVNNCIGRRNRLWFLFFVFSMNVVNGLAAYLFYITFLNSVLFKPAAILTVILIVFGLIIGLTINSFVCKQAFSNLTLSETQKWKRYNYLQNADGTFFNPFDEGCVSNFLLFFNVKTLNYIK